MTFPITCSYRLRVKGYKYLGICHQMGRHLSAEHIKGGKG